MHENAAKRTKTTSVDYRRITRLYLQDRVSLAAIRRVPNDSSVFDSSVFVSSRIIRRSLSHV